MLRAKQGYCNRAYTHEPHIHLKSHDMSFVHTSFRNSAQIVIASLKDTLLGNNFARFEVKIGLGRYFILQELSCSKWQHVLITL